MFHWEKRRLLIACGLMLGLALVVGQVFAAWHQSQRSGHGELVALDYSAFYCAGATANAHGNPYRTVPYDACGDEHRALPVRYLAHRLPAPIPGYDVALFRGFAKLPFERAVGIWLGLSVGAALAGILALASLTGVPILIVFVCVATTLRESLQLGQVTPLVFAALALAGYALTKGKHALAGVAATVAMIEPHVGLAAMLAMFVWVPRSRIVLIAGGAVLAAISIATLGVAGNLEYVRVVLPSHALAEVPTNAQYSLTWLLYVLGMDEHLAIRIAEFQYAITLLAGIVCAGPLATRLASPALVPFIAAASAVIGGPFIHITQISAIGILPLLVIVGRRNDLLAWIAIVLLAMNWGNMTWFPNAWSPARLECAAITALIIAYALRKRPSAMQVGCACVALVAYLGITAAVLRVPQSPIRSLDSAAQYRSDNRMASGYTTLEWGLYQRAMPTNPSREAFAAKIPTWIGLLVLVTCVAPFMWRRPVPAVREFAMPEIASAAT